MSSLSPAPLRVGVGAFGASLHHVLFRSLLVGLLLAGGRPPSGCGGSPPLVFAAAVTIKSRRPGLWPESQGSFWRLGTGAPNPTASSGQGILAEPEAEPRFAPPLPRLALVDAGLNLSTPSVGVPTAGGGSLRGTTTPGFSSPYTEEVLKLRSFASQAPKFDPLCMANTGRTCDFQGSAGKDLGDEEILTYLNECKSGPQEDCMSWKVGDDLQVGYCVCTEGFCSNSEGKCVPRGSMLVGQSFRITTKKFGTNAPLYMAPDGTVRVALGPGHVYNAGADVWRIVVQSDGTMQFYTQAYFGRLLDLYNRCITLATGQVRCEMVVGHHLEPFPTEVAWRLDHTHKVEGSGNEYLMLREIHANAYLFASPISHETLGCPVNSQNCPDEVGELWFDPPVIAFVEVPITEMPPPRWWVITTYIGMGFAATFLVCLCIINVRYDQKHNRFF